VNAADFYDWKRHPMTQVVLEQFAARVRDLKESLSYEAGKDPQEDRFKAGYIAAFNDIILMEYEGDDE
jgi:hypothetical protein